MEDLRALRHTAAHVLAMAVKKLYPVSLGIGPAIDDGFYYDFGTSGEDFDLELIEKEMRAIVKQRLPLVMEELNAEDARIRLKNEPYKLELLEDLIKDEKTPYFYKMGDFSDLCAGPHVENTERISAFKLTSVAGAYWRGDEKKPMLTRIYGTAFFNKEELKEHLRRLEEAKKRDHRIIGRDMELFALMEEGQGFPFFLPNGLILKNLLFDFWRELHKKAGYFEIQTPIMLSSELWERSGHAAHYSEGMFNSVVDETQYRLKPMNCPGAMLTYASSPHSYKEFPLRMAELGFVHRYEKSGTLRGLMRTRAFTQDDAHIFMLDEQIEQEVLGVLELLEKIYSAFGFKWRLELSTRPENSMGTDEEWEFATNALRRALERKGAEFSVNEGDGAFYGPKIDAHLEDALGRGWQCGTIQLDMLMPERFGLDYTDSDGKKRRPVVLHRAILGSIERFIAVAIEHTAGWLPVRFAPVQAVVLPVSEKHLQSAKKLFEILQANGVRAKLFSQESLSKRIRQSRKSRIPFMLVLGDNEVDSQNANLRYRDGNDFSEAGVLDISEIIKKIKELE